MQDDDDDIWPGTMQLLNDEDEEKLRNLQLKILDGISKSLKIVSWNIIKNTLCLKTCSFPECMTKKDIEEFMRLEYNEPDVQAFKVEAFEKERKGKLI